MVQRNLPVIQRNLPVIQRNLPVVQRNLPVIQRSLPVIQRNLPVLQRSPQVRLHTPVKPIKFHPFMTIVLRKDAEFHVDSHCTIPDFVRPQKSIKNNRKLGIPGAEGHLRKMRRMSNFDTSWNKLNDHRFWPKFNQIYRQSLLQVIVLVPAL